MRQTSKLQSKINFISEDELMQSIQNAKLEYKKGQSAKANSILWIDCLNCRDKCCKWKDIAYPLFLTNEEKLIFLDINKKYPCQFFTEDEKCSIYKNRLFDCRIYPFDLIQINGEWYWFFWKTSCIILKKSRNELECFLEEHEKNIIPKYKKYIKPYSKYKFEELKNKYDMEILKKVKFQ